MINSVKNCIGMWVVVVLYFAASPSYGTNTVDIPIEERQFQLDIQSMQLGKAMDALHNQTRLQLIYPFELAESNGLTPIKGTFTIEQALTQMLEQTGFSGGLLESGVVVISQTEVNMPQDKTMNNKSKQPTHKRSVLASVIAFLFSGTAIAQDADSANQDDADKKQSTLEVITVTSEKRVQNLQEVPIAISAFSADMLDARGIETPQDLQFSVPGMVIAEQFTGPAKVTVRGIGSENIFPGGDPGVPIHINGHYTQNTAYVLRDMLDVERVEVLRGPQGTLYGRNSIGGSINIITSKPTDYFESSISTTVGNYGKRNIQAMLSGPLSEDLSGRLVVADDKRDGYVKNLGIGGDRDTSDYTAFKGALLYSPSDKFNMLLNLHHFDDASNPGSRLVTEYPTGPIGGGNNYYELNDAGENPTVQNPFTVSQNTPAKQTNKSKGASLDISWDFGAAEFRSLTSWDDSTWSNFADADGSSVVGDEFVYNMDFEIFTQELQLLSKDESDLSWVFGLFYYDEKSSYFNEILKDQTTVDVDGNGIVDQNDPRRYTAGGIYVDASSLGIFGQINYSLSEQLELVLGLRYSKDEKEAEEPGFIVGAYEGQVPLPAPVFAIFPKRGETWSKVTGKLGLNYYLDDDVMFYASYSSGYKTGGFNLTQPEPYKPEEVKAWEAGLKSRWFDNRVQANLSAFYYDYQDKQDFRRFNSGDFVVFNILNAAEATSKGVELELEAYLTDSILADVSIGYLNATFDEFESRDVTRGDVNFDLSGNYLAFSPEISFNFGLKHEWEIDGNGYMSTRLGYTYIDEQFTNAFNRDSSSGLVGDADRADSYFMINGFLKWESIDEDWSIELYGNNLTDEVILSNPYVDGTNKLWGTYLAPRNYGLKVSYHFF